jgi:hypothetical protein
MLCVIFLIMAPALTAVASGPTNVPAARRKISGLFNKGYTLCSGAFPEPHGCRGANADCDAADPECTCQGGLLCMKAAKSERHVESDPADGELLSAGATDQRRRALRELRPDGLTLCTGWNPAPFGCDDGDSDCDTTDPGCKCHQGLYCAKPSEEALRARRRAEEENPHKDCNAQQAGSVRLEDTYSYAGRLDAGLFEFAPPPPPPSQ